jgi:hypothetical protein
MVREKEEVFYTGNRHLFSPQDKCFATFLADLNSMEALVYIPEDRVSQARKYEISRLSGDKATKRNADFNKRSSAYVQISPIAEGGSECQKSIALNFNNLGMRVFVKKDKVRNAQDVLQVKVEKGASLSSELIRVDSRSTETLMFKVERGSWTNFVPVGL